MSWISSKGLLQAANIGINTWIHPLNFWFTETKHLWGMSHLSLKQTSHPKYINSSPLPVMGAGSDCPTSIRHEYLTLGKASPVWNAHKLPWADQPKGWQNRSSPPLGYSRPRGQGTRHWLPGKSQPAAWHKGHLSIILSESVTLTKVILEMLDFIS